MPLPAVTKGPNWAFILDDTLIKTQDDYNTCAKRHNKLVDALEQRESIAP